MHAVSCHDLRVMIFVSTSLQAFSIEDIGLQKTRRSTLLNNVSSQWLSARGVEALILKCTIGLQWFQNNISITVCLFEFFINMDLMGLTVWVNKFSFRCNGRGDLSKIHKLQYGQYSWIVHNTNDFRVGIADVWSYMCTNVVIAVMCECDVIKPDTADISRMGRNGWTERLLWSRDAK